MVCGREDPLIRRLLLILFPGDARWLWRRAGSVSSVATFLYCIVVASNKGDSATVGQLVIGLGAVLGIYTGGAVTDDHLRRNGQGAQP